MRLKRWPPSCSSFRDSSLTVPSSASTTSSSGDTRYTANTLVICMDHHLLAEGYSGPHWRTGLRALNRSCARASLYRRHPMPCVDADDAHLAEGRRTRMGGREQGCDMYAARWGGAEM